uniref:Uncharacterized protein n=1 Tax=Zea mays TaxID=4577 RepID=B6SSC3_MAIZE|nr:hypothetical protein [Zea mays]
MWREALMELHVLRQLSMESISSPLHARLCVDEAVFFCKCK